ncbi:MAG: head GIN domain-containing protein [Saprospiraceae bacterium]
MRYLLFFMFLVGVFVLGQFSCGDNNWSFGPGIRGKGPAKTESRSVSDFRTVEAKIPGSVEVRVGDKYAVEVHAQENLLPILRTEVVDGSLQIYFSENVSNTDDLLVKITAPAYEGLSVSGSADMEVLSRLKGNELYLAVSGSGSVSLPEADVSALNCDIAGSGTLEVSGRAQIATFEISGSGDINAEGLEANTGKANIAGSGSLKCNMKESLKANIAGSGDIYYTGSASVETSVAGSGTVKKLD